MTDYIEELTEIRKVIPAEYIHTVHPNVIVCDFKQSRTKQMRVEVHMIEGYPETKLSFQLSSNLIPDSALGELKGKLLEGLVKAPNKMQALFVLNKIHTTLTTNRFMSCWQEVLQIRQLIGEKKTKLNAQTGLIKLKLKTKNYTANVSITVPDQYPDVSPTIKLSGCNMDPRLTKAIVQQSERLVYKLLMGVDAETALTFHDRTAILENTAKLEQKEV